jgi:hypothetical protein
VALKHQVPALVGVNELEVAVAELPDPERFSVESKGVPVAGHKPGWYVDDVLIWQR